MRPAQTRPPAPSRNNCTLARSGGPECKSLGFYSLDRIWAAGRSTKLAAARGELAPRELEDDACYEAGPSPTTCCFGRCSDHGSCVRGVCVCAPPHHGIDCAESNAGQSAATGMPSRRGGGGSSSEGFVYVHNPPGNLGVRQMRRFQTHGGYNADYYLLARMLEDRRVRTTDATAAQLFYMPTFASDQHGNAAYHKNVQVQGALVRWLDSVGLRQHWLEHPDQYVFQFTGDKGSCLLPRSPIYVAHWGLTVPWSHMDAPHTWMSPPAGEARPEQLPCATAHDVIVPPWMAWTRYPNVSAQPRRHAAAAATAGSADRGVGGTWRCQLFWAGSIAHTYALHYSGGMRQLVWEHHRNRTGFCIDRRLPSEYYEQARFCLAPSGDGWGDRLQKSIRAGCIPVIVQPGVLMPFEDVLPYHRFSLRFGANEVPTMHERLAAIGEAEHARMRRTLLRYAAAFNWHEIHGQAYELTVFSLCLRAAQLSIKNATAPTPQPLEAARSRCEHLRPAMLAPEHAAARTAGRATIRMKP